MNPELAQLLKAYLSSEDPRTHRMVLADWLEDHGNRDDAEAVRAWIVYAPVPDVSIVPGQLWSGAIGRRLDSLFFDGVTLHYVGDLRNDGLGYAPNEIAHARIDEPEQRRVPMRFGAAGRCEARLKRYVLPPRHELMFGYCECREHAFWRVPWYPDELAKLAGERRAAKEICEQLRTRL